MEQREFQALPSASFLVLGGCCNRLSKTEAAWVRTHHHRQRKEAFFPEFENIVISCP